MMAPTEEDKARACRDAIRWKAGDLISDLHDLDGSKRGGAFNSANYAKARDFVEAAVAELEGMIDE